LKFEEKLRFYAIFAKLDNSGIYYITNMSVIKKTAIAIGMLGLLACSSQNSTSSQEYESSSSKQTESSSLEKCKEWLDGDIVKFDEVNVRDYNCATTNGIRQCPIIGTGEKYANSIFMNSDATGISKSCIIIDGSNEILQLMGGGIASEKDCHVGATIWIAEGIVLTSKTKEEICLN